ncbi:MAG: hypothetical protein RJA22_3222 [Verrucomicrobiota bacterium]
MNAGATRVSGPWRAGHWAGVVLGVMALQAGLLIYFGQRAPAPAPDRPRFATAVHFVPEGAEVGRLAGLGEALEPTLLALPARESFSGAAWMRGRELGEASASRAEEVWWLGLETRDFGGELAELAAANGVEPSTIAEKPAPPLLRYEPRFPSEPLPARSVLRVEGSLAGRRLVQAPVLPAWPHGEILSNTVVHVVVDAEGFPLTAETLSGCGWVEADRQALRLAMGVRFAVVPQAGRDETGRGPLAWGRLVFRWATLPAAATNGMAGLP